MQTIVGISLSPVYILPLMFIFSIIGRTLLFRVRYFLSDTEHLWYKTHTAVLSGIWLYSIAVALIILSPSQLLYRIHAVLILSFMLQMAVTDALTGLLPGTFTRRFLIAGILSQITTDIWWLRATEIVSAALSYSVCINWLTAIVLILAQETCGLLQVLPHGQGYITPYGVCCWAQEDLSYGIQHGA